MGRFCVDCLYYTTDDYRVPYCAFGDRRDPVSGQTNYPSCDFERSYDGGCRPIGKNWVQETRPRTPSKPSFWQRIGLAP